MRDLGLWSAALLRRGAGAGKREARARMGDDYMWFYKRVWFCLVSALAWS